MKKQEIQKLQARAKRRHNLSKEEFLLLTPNEYKFYEDDLEYEERYRELLVGRICSTLVNINLKKGAKPFKDQDFLSERFRAPDIDTSENIEKDLDKLAKTFGFKKIICPPPQ